MDSTIPTPNGWEASSRGRPPHDATTAWTRMTPAYHATRHAHFLKQDFKVFDAPFFSVTPKEAKAMDPTQRMLLEAAYEGFENGT